MTRAGAVGALQRRRTPDAHGAARRRIGPDWPLWALTVGMPLLFLVGLQGLAWSLPVVVFGTALATRPSVRIPRTALWLVLFCGWALLSVIQLHGSYFAVFGYRWTLFAGTLACLVWVANRSEDKLPTERLVGWLAALWIVVVAFGYLAIALPHLDMVSPIQRVLGPLGRAHFIADISGWRLAELQTSQGVTLPRPAAPFPASNGWGASIGLLTPFFIRSWIVEARRGRRGLGILLLIVGMVPILVSGNRGLWIGVTIALGYWAFRRMLQGDLRPLVALGALALIVVATMLLTPAGKLVTERLNTAGRSNVARSSVYSLAWHGTLESPLVGHGIPTQVTDQTLPPIGTHGLFWYLMYCHGFVGLALFCGWLVTEVVRSGRIRAPGGWWTHLSLVIALVQLPFYGMLPQVELIGVAAALAHRETGPGRARDLPGRRGARDDAPTGPGSVAGIITAGAPSPRDGRRGAPAEVGSGRRLPPAQVAR